MSASKVRPGQPDDVRHAVCGTCQRYDRLLREGFGFRGPVLSSVLTPEDFAAAEQVIAEAKPELIQALHRDGIPLGRIALYQLAIRSKRSI